METSIEILDASGEDGLTFRSLSERLATGAGAIYWHVDNKSDLLTAACFAIVEKTMATVPRTGKPEAIIRMVALGIFDASDAHPWIGSAFARSPGQHAILLILEAIGQQVRRLGVPDTMQWAATSALLSYILGVSGQNASNAQTARAGCVNRSEFLSEMSVAWAKLDPDTYPFARSMAETMQVHDDRADYLAGIDFILNGMNSGSDRQ